LSFKFKGKNNFKKGKLNFQITYNKVLAFIFNLKQLSNPMDKVKIWGHSKIVNLELKHRKSQDSLPLNHIKRIILSFSQF